MSGRFWLGSIMVLAAGLLLFAWMAGITGTTPWQPTMHWAAEPLEAQPLTGQLKTDQDAAYLGDADSAGATAVLWPAPAQLAESSIAKVCVQNVDQLTRVLLLWRAEGALHRQLMPGLGAGCSYVDLSAHIGWTPSVDAVGLALLPVDYFPPTAVSHRQVRIDAVEFSSESIPARAAALLEDWLAYRPWGGRSINTQGFAFGNTAGPSQYSFLILWALSAAVIFAGLRVIRLTHALRGALLCAVALIALQQTWQIAIRALEAQSAVTVASSSQAELAAQPAFAPDINALSQQLAERRVRRIFIGADDRFSREYPLWLMRQWDAGFVWPEQWGMVLPVLHADDLVVMAGRGNWAFDGERQMLRIGELELAAEPLHQGTWLSAFAPTGLSNAGGQP